MTTPPLFLGEPDLLVQATVGSPLALTGPEGRHAAVVRRIRPGEVVDVADGAGLRCRCTVLAADRDGLRLQVAAVDRVPAPQPTLVVVQALAKGDAGVDAVRTMTEVGVDELVPWAAARSVVQWRDDDGGRPLQRWRDAAREAAKQSRRAYVPQVAAPAGTDDVAARVARATLAVVLHAAAAIPLATATLPAAGEMVLVVGPEGGLADTELARLTAAGATACRLGPTVLRSATAGTAAAALVLARVGRWS